MEFYSALILYFQNEYTMMCWPRGQSNIFDNTSFIDFQTKIIQIHLGRSNLGVCKQFQYFGV